MPTWVIVQILFDIGLVGIILWLSWRSSATTAREPSRLTSLLQSIELKTAQLQAQLQRAEEALKRLRRADSEPRLDAPFPSSLPSNPYEEASWLAQQGYTVDEIVSRVKLPRAEVSLIMHLQEHAQVCPQPDSLARNNVAPGVESSSIPVPSPAPSGKMEQGVQRTI